MGVCQTAGRIAFLHKNEKGAISHFTALLGDAGVNIDNMSNKSKGDYAYTMMDVDAPVSSEVMDKIHSLPGVFKVRVIK
jgi:D-3-phosphoglycerate dehydrogenase